MPVICCQFACILATCCRLSAGVLHAACCMLHIACCWLLVAYCMPFVLILSAAIVDEMLYMFHVSCILLLLPAACCKFHVACCRLQVDWCTSMCYNTGRHATYRSLSLVSGSLHAAYSLPVLLVACYPLLVARCLPASAALGGDLPQSAQG